MKENYIEVECEGCGAKFERFVYHPYIKKCKACRKSGTGSVAAPEVAVVSDNGKGYQYLPEWGIKLKACCFGKMKAAADKGYHGAIQCSCINQFRVVASDKVGIGMGMYAIGDGQVVLLRNYYHTMGGKQ